MTDQSNQPVEHSVTSSGALDSRLACMYWSLAHLSKEEKERVMRIDAAEYHAVLQNDTDAAGDGPNRFMLRWGT